MLSRSIVVAATVAAVVGCGAGGNASPDAVRSAWRTAAAAAAGGDGTGFCELVTSAGKQAITSQTNLPCEDSVRLLGARLTAADKAAIRDAKITKVQVHGDDATVSYVTTRSLAAVGFTGRTSLHRSDGRWLLVGVS
jgi:hypothetical protein